MTDTRAPISSDLERNETPVNLYDALGLDRDDSTSMIREKLGLLSLQWSNRASRAGGPGDEAREQVALIEIAEVSFASEDSREQYDLSLIRRPSGSSVAPAVIDWKSRAWTYYFLEDDGAAAVAARKAREATPDDPLTFVISAWIQIREGELRQAKQSADEAFVLDELGEDTPDAHHVRGFVFYLNDEFDRALQGYGRALAKAGRGEKPEIYLRTAWAHGKKREFLEMFESAEQGLSQGVEMPASIRIGLDEAICRAMFELCEDTKNPTSSSSQYRAWAERVRSSSVRPDSKALVETYVAARCAANDRLLESMRQISDLEGRRRDLSSIQPPSGGKPGFPVFFLVVGIVLLFSGPAWFVLALAGLVAIAVAGFVIYLRVKWTGAATAHRHAQAQLGAVLSRLQEAGNQRGQLIAQMQHFVPVAE